MLGKSKGQRGKEEDSSNTLSNKDKYFFTKRGEKRLHCPGGGKMGGCWSNKPDIQL